MLKKLFGGNNDFFLDLSDGTEAPAAEPTTPAAVTEPAPTATPEPASTPTAPVVAPVAAAVTEAPAAQPAATEPAAEAPAPTEATPEPAPAPEPEPVLVNFATTYLKPTGKGMARRRPSANMSSFVEMARSVRN